ncbi:DUF6064 family protein [Phyllobacterium endophyticum]|uniref:MFS transporter permease n=1 Tax=Phyllobacterium endophyticum TaxID=1149773 RepID=A0A2P7AND7_9HYPH|nr:DUF6064 family protein [Phyllobacterium endophyticum]MBB3233998.1 hypothetical protein [Phyllobacterium endophyticum]PSH55705.1 hypothetical protein CU100_18655 [Phyllobacterium endophyticum]TYR43775.1 hypothetical protein FY050_00895 [Phyllobacterium endophyticum]
MSEWLTYRPGDFLLFSPRVYWRMFELQNAAVWPLQLGTFIAGFAIIFVVIARPNGKHRWIAFVLAVLWTFVGWTFVWHRYATINWAMAYVAPFFVLQSLLLLIAVTVPTGLVFGRRGFARWIGGLLTSIALFLYPALPYLSGSSLPNAEVFGIAPDPTAIGTMGLLLMARGSLVPVLFLVPVIWCLITTTTLWAMGSPEAWLPSSALALTLVSAVWSRQSRSSPHGGT